MAQLSEQVKQALQDLSNGCRELLLTLNIKTNDGDEEQPFNDKYSLEQLENLSFWYRYDLALISTLSDPKKAKAGNIYLSEDGSYLVLDSKGDVQNGNLDKDIDLSDLKNKLNNHQLKNQILEYTTTKAKHTSTGIVFIIDEIKSKHIGTDYNNNLIVIENNKTILQLLCTLYICNQLLNNLDDYISITSGKNQNDMLNYLAIIDGNSNTWVPSLDEKRPEASLKLLELFFGFLKSFSNKNNDDKEYHINDKDPIIIEIANSIVFSGLRDFPAKAAFRTLLMARDVNQICSNIIEGIKSQYCKCNFILKSVESKIEGRAFSEEIIRITKNNELLDKLINQENIKTLIQKQEIKNLSYLSLSSLSFSFESFLDQINIISNGEKSGLSGSSGTKLGVEESLDFEFSLNEKATIDSVCNNKNYNLNLSVSSNLMNELSKENSFNIIAQIKSVINKFNISYEDYKNKNIKYPDKKTILKNLSKKLSELDSLIIENFDDVFNDVYGNESYLKFFMDEKYIGRRNVISKNKRDLSDEDKKILDKFIHMIDELNFFSEGYDFVLVLEDDFNFETYKKNINLLLSKIKMMTGINYVVLKIMTGN